MKLPGWQPDEAKKMAERRSLIQAGRIHDITRYITLSAVKGERLEDLGFERAG